MAAQAVTNFNEISEQEYNRRIRAWTMYDWANSAFATTILAAVLPIYYSQVAGATLPSASVATAYWSTGLSVSLLLVAIMSPVLGTISDIMRGKKRFLAVFWGIGVVATGLLVLVSTGDWMLASILFILGRIGFTGANVFYDALLPHVAKPEDQDKVSTRGYAMGYLGGGILLAINVVMIFLDPEWGTRLSFLSVAVWWAVFTIPLFRNIPEPPSATEKLEPGENVVAVSVRRLRDTLKDIGQYRELVKYLIAFLIYIDGVGTIIGVAAIYGAELGFDSVDLILALLLVQFVGIPFSIIFGRLPSKKEKRRPFFLAFIVFNMIFLPLVGITGSRLLSADVTGAPPPPYEATATAVGEGSYLATDDSIDYTGSWQPAQISADLLGSDSEAVYQTTTEPNSDYQFSFNGQDIILTYSLGPDHGIWAVEMDGSSLLDEETGEPIMVDAYNETVRYGESQVLVVSSPGEHTLRVLNTGESNPDSGGIVMTLYGTEVLPPARQSNLALILGLILVVEVVGLGLSYLLGPALFSGLADTIDTKRAILLALLVYIFIAIWGFFLDSVVEFWFLAWMVAVVQGGSQGLSRSLFSSMAPASKSGEFFGLFGVMEKFSAIVGPLIFAFVAVSLGNSRPAVLSIVLFFIVGGYLLTRVDVDEGRRVAQAEDAAAMESVSGV
jgi:UMF1 family MFS transporter